VTSSCQATRHPDESRQTFLDRQPTYWLKRCYQTLRRRVDAELRPFGITLSQRDALLALRHDGPTAIGDLATSLGLEQSSASRLVEGLRRRGLVRLEEGPHDRRSRWAYITDAGSDILDSTPGASIVAAQLFRDELTSGELADLTALLKRCTNILEERDDALNRR